MSGRPEFSKGTKLKAFAACGGHCQRCSAKLSVGNVQYHHDTECTMGGGCNPENCIVLCKSCHRVITSTRAPVIAKSTRIRAKHIGAATPSRRPLPGGRRSKWKRTFSRGWTRR